jgi:hypothetical protein
MENVFPSIWKSGRKAIRRGIDTDKYTHAIVRATLKRLFDSFRACPCSRQSNTIVNFKSTIDDSVDQYYRLKWQAGAEILFISRDE